MTSYPQVECDASQAYNPFTTAVSTSCRNISSDPSSGHNTIRTYGSSVDTITHFTDAQLSLPLGLASAAPGRAVPPVYLSSRLNLEHYNMSVNSASLPLNHNIPFVVLPTPTPRQKQEIQLAGQEPFDFTFSLQNPEPYIYVDDPQLTQVHGLSVAGDDSLTRASGLPPHLGLSINYVRHFLSPDYCVPSMNHIITLE